jgi:simple sugar transport system permease protein
VAVVFLAAGVVAWWVRSARGFAFDVYGTSPALAARMGVRRAGVVLATMLTGGAAAGLAGWMQVAGLQGRLYPSVAGGLGFTGIVVALLAGLRPGAVLGVALLFGVLATGTEGLQAGIGVPAPLATVLQAVLLGGIALLSALRYRRIQRAATDEPRKQPAGETGRPAGETGRPDGVAGEGSTHDVGSRPPQREVPR